MTVSPFCSRYFSNLMSGSAARAPKASARQPIAAILRMDGLRRACLTRVPRGGKARIRVLRILGHFLREPGWPLEALALVRQLDFGQPEIALAKVVELEAPEPAPHLAQAARAHPQQGLRVRVGNRVVELRPGQETVPLDGQLGVTDPVVRGDQPHPHRRIHAEVALLQLVALRQLPGEEVLPHQKFPLDLYAHRDLLISPIGITAERSTTCGRLRFPPGSPCAPSGTRATRPRRRAPRACRADGGPARWEAADRRGRARRRRESLAASPPAHGPGPRARGSRPRTRGPPPPDRAGATRRPGRFPLPG